MKNSIQIENVSKTYFNTRRKFWFQNFSQESATEPNVTISKSHLGPITTQSRSTKALHNVSLNVRKGQILGLLGPNGAGKTSLAKIISTLVLPDTGNVYVNGYDVESETVMARFSLGLVTGGERSLYWKLTALQNLEFFGGLYGIEKSTAKDRAIEYLTTFGLKHKQSELVQNLSTGQKMKVAFIRALMHDPEILILDEYNRGLDPNASRQLRDYIKKELQLKQKKTILVMTHSMDVAEDLSDEIILIDTGKVIAQGSPTSLMSRIKKTQSLELESKERFSPEVIELLKVYGELEVSNGLIHKIRIRTDTRPKTTLEVLNLLESQHVELSSLNVKSANLEDVFVHFTGKKLEEELE